MGVAPTAPPHSNRLIHESSPYLLQHAHNPVDWYPWGDEAFARAKAEGKPVFLSVGYATCHWCHVMERESFEDEKIAALMNRDFIAIKVDREERPDIDNVYMTACQLMTQSGGWPLTVILTPEGKPFFAGTYFPPDSRSGRMGMTALLPRLAEAWKSQHAEIEKQADELTDAVRQVIASPPDRGGAEPLDARFADAVLADLSRRFDPKAGGFSSAPKFPPHGALQFLLARARAGRDPEVDRMLRVTLDRMQDGGIFDQVGGGFHRYSVDGEWFIPHFEKMLYDNAQLLEIYAGAARVFGDARYRETALRTFEFLERELKTPEGAYASALDADSEGKEGEYYLWTAKQIDAVLGAESRLYRSAYGIADGGNTPPFFEEGAGRNLPRRTRTVEDLAREAHTTVPDVSARLSADNEKLLAERSRRERPMRDDKVVTSWNALAASALARAARDLGEPRLRRTAERLVDYLRARHVTGDGVLHVSRDGAARLSGFLEDDAFLARALLDLAESRPEYAADSRKIAGWMVDRFSDAKAGGFFESRKPSGDRGLLELAKEYLDQVVPSPNGVAIDVLRRLEGPSEPRLRTAADSAFAAAAPYARAYPSASFTLAALAASRPAGKPPRLPSSKTSGPVDVALSLSPASVAPGAEARLLVGIRLDRGWHIQSHTPTRDYLIATEVAVHPADGITAGAPVYPDGEDAHVAGDVLSVYSGSATVAIPVTVATDAPAGPREIKVTIRFQACDAAECLAPAEVSLSLPVEISR